MYSLFYFDSISQNLLYKFLSKNKNKSDTEQLVLRVQCPLNTHVVTAVVLVKLTFPFPHKEERNDIIYFKPKKPNISL